MLNSNIIFNILYISHDFHNDSKQFFLFVSLYFMRDIHRGEGIQNNSLAGFGMQFPSLMHMETARLLNCYFFCFAHAWGSMMDQVFHEGVDGPKSLGAPALMDNRHL